MKSDSPLWQVMRRPGFLSLQRMCAFPTRERMREFLTRERMRQAISPVLVILGPAKPEIR
jgi:hypothetical protein